MNSLTGNLPDEGEWERQYGFGAGLTLEYEFNPYFALSIQPSFARREARQVFQDNRGNLLSATDFDLDYVSVPLVARVTSGSGGVRGMATAGLDVSFLLDATASSDSQSQDITDALNPTAIGAHFGAGILVPVSRHYLSFEVRYVQGLTDIVDRDGEDPDLGTAGESVKYRGLNLIVGFLFTLGGGS